MSAADMPTRQWGPREPAAEVKPTILVSSREPAPLPRVAGAVKLADVARAAGWWVRTGYSKVAVPERRYLNGDVAKASHQLECVGVWLRRPAERGWAMWHSEDGGSYRFAHAFVGITRHGWRATAKAPSILDRVAVSA